MSRLLRAAMLALVVWSSPSLALDPKEKLPDPALEARAREVAKDLRCLVCRNESIDDSNADLARDLRRLVRERLVAGDSNDAVLSFVVARYGDYVLLQPPVKPSTWVLWFGPFLLLVGAGIYTFRSLRRTHSQIAAPSPLNAGEKAAVAALMREADTPTNKHDERS